MSRRSHRSTRKKDQRISAPSVGKKISVDIRAISVREKMSRRSHRSTQKKDQRISAPSAGKKISVDICEICESKYTHKYDTYEKNNALQHPVAVPVVCKLQRADQ